jgi:SAM-dependent methyltransferase
MDPQTHWNQVYHKKTPQQLSWTQEVPYISLDFINGLHLPANARIIDVGGGDSRLVDYLLEKGYTDLTVLDISQEALDRAQNRLGNKARLVKWIVSDITDFTPEHPYDLWHDRATFHFLTTVPQITRYIDIAGDNITTGGHLIIATFSQNGPTQCSGLPVLRYAETDLTEALGKHFKKIVCITEDHITPLNTAQNFLFCSFKRA